MLFAPGPSIGLGQNPEVSADIANVSSAWDPVVWYNWDPHVCAATEAALDMGTASVSQSIVNFIGGPKGHEHWIAVLYGMIL
jgi:hypothetical protein